MCMVLTDIKEPFETSLRYMIGHYFVLKSKYSFTDAIDSYIVFGNREHATFQIPYYEPDTLSRIFHTLSGETVGTSHKDFKRFIMPTDLYGKLVVDIEL